MTADEQKKSIELLVKSLNAQLELYNFLNPDNMLTLVDVCGHMMQKKYANHDAKVVEAFNQLLGNPLEALGAINLTAPKFVVGQRLKKKLAGEIVVVSSIQRTLKNEIIYHFKSNPNGLLWDFEHGLEAFAPWPPLEGNNT